MYICCGCGDYAGEGEMITSHSESGAMLFSFVWLVINNNTTIGDVRSSLLGNKGIWDELNGVCAIASVVKSLS